MGGVMGLFVQFVLAAGCILATAAAMGFVYRRTDSVAATVLAWFVCSGALMAVIA